MAEPQAAPVGTDREYETIYVLRPDIERQKAADVSARVTDVIGKAGGKLTRVENWGRRVLAYPVQRHKRGVYVYLKYLGGGDLVSELERNLRMLDSVIKFQTVKLAEALSAGSIAVADEDVKFEDVEEAPEDEEEISLARSLGLEADEEAPDAADESADEGGADSEDDGLGEDGDTKKDGEEASTEDTSAEKGDE